jgi:hypothetical protein
MPDIYRTLIQVSAGAANPTLHQTAHAPEKKKRGAFAAGERDYFLKVKVKINKYCCFLP